REPQPSSRRRSRRRTTEGVVEPCRVGTESRLGRRDSARPRQGRPGRREARQLSVCEARQQGRAGLEERPEKDLVGWRLENLRSFRRAWCGGDRRRLLLPRRLSYGGAALLRGRAARRLPAQVEASRIRGRWQRVAVLPVLPAPRPAAAAAHGG